MDKPAAGLPGSTGEALVREVMEKRSVFSVLLMKNINNINCPFFTPVHIIYISLTDIINVVKKKI